jgi:hypothetical protein
MSLPESINSLFPKYKSKIINGNVSIEEKDPKAKLREIQFEHSEFWRIDTTMIKDFSSFFQIAESPDFLCKDCDGIVVFEYNGQKYMLIVELKSSFDTETIFYARKQIISTYIKLNILLNIIPEYKKDEYICKGVIASLNPDDNKQNWISKMLMLDDNDPEKKKVYFALNLYNDKERTITKDLCQEMSSCELSNKCMFDKLTFNYIGVELGNSTHTLPISDFLS